MLNVPDGSSNELWSQTYLQTQPGQDTTDERSGVGFKHNSTCDIVVLFVLNTYARCVAVIF